MIRPLLLEMIPSILWRDGLEEEAQMKSYFSSKEKMRFHEGFEIAVGRKGENQELFCM